MKGLFLTSRVVMFIILLFWVS